MSNIILAIDSSMDCCSVALYKKKCIHSLLEKCKKKHTIKILPMIREILFQTKTKFKELNYVSFTKGPGNFTGLRITESIAQSLSLSLNIPMISISTLAILAEKAWRKYKKNKIIVIINAKKTQVYWAEYKRNHESIWIGEHTESLLEKKLIKNKINDFKKQWMVISDDKCQLVKSEKLLYLNKNELFLPNAKDIIPFALLKIKEKKFFYSGKNSINYLYNEF